MARTSHIWGYRTPRYRDIAPGPEPVWDGTYEAIEDKIMCLQCQMNPFTGEFKEKPVGQEDCLILNVYTPAFPSDSMLPVMVFIHGGGFIEGSSIPILYGPNYLVPKGVILVTINYRLNLLGYLNLGIENVPGNAGMKDQVAALRWIQKNIKAFGGDPDNVTIFGESAGGASVSYHLLSPMSKGLFHKGITQSGSSLCPWAFQQNPAHNAYRIATIFGYDTKDPHELYKIFNNLPISKLRDIRFPKDLKQTLFSELIFAPSLEKNLDGVEAFLTENPHKLLTTGNYTKVPLIIGSTDEEGYFFVGVDGAVMSESILDFVLAMPNNIEISSESDKKSVAREIRKMYLGDELHLAPVKISGYYGDPYISYPVLAETELLLKTSVKPIYNYVFKYSGWRNIGKAFAGREFWSEPGATHADDLFYLFHQPFMSWLALLDREMIEKITTLWTNFAKYGDPTPATSELFPERWLPTTATDPRAFVLDQDHSTVPLWFKDSLKYWRELYYKYRK
ncbi:cholinesterase 1-like isoform X2 [Leguminivora glycinivorella]|uniref:cholinesterase 1-like isoform X2 n=1 Tax=Leguminivora glycinivorella TaxID=1035111 RepID=UPI00200EEB5F|nr:cholinesterase 1-like isoform X2 [Leguminivora glycinivorella]